MQKLFIFFIIAFSACSPVEQTSLVGEWMPTKVTVYNAFSKVTAVYYDRNHQLDTLYFKNKQDKRFIKADSAKLYFKDDSVLYIDNNGVIIPSEPGWYFGDKLGGKWLKNGDKLKFIIGDNKINHPFFYKIIKSTNNRLILGMTMEDYGQVYMTLEFVRR